LVNAAKTLVAKLEVDQNVRTDWDACPVWLETVSRMDEADRVKFGLCEAPHRVRFILMHVEDGVEFGNL
jgi:hypothetical protein